MTIQVHTSGFTADEKLIKFIESKLVKLEKFYDKIMEIDVYLKLESHAKVKDKTIEIRTHIPGDTLFAIEKAVSFEAAINYVFDVAKGQLKKKKEKTKQFLPKEKLSTLS